MSKYTPTYEEVREFYANSEWSNAGEEFDRWLAQHDAEVAEETLNKAIALLKSEPEETKGLRRALQIVSLLATRQGPRDET